MKYKNTMFKIYITLKSFEFYYLEKNTLFLKNLYLLLNEKIVSNNVKIDLLTKQESNNLTLKKINFISFNETNLPIKRKLFTVLRSVHVYKKSREQFHFTVKTKKLCIQVKNMKTMFILLFLIKNTEFYGVEMEISFHYNSVF